MFFLFVYLHAYLLSLCLPHTSHTITNTDPIIDNQVLAANIGCDMPFETDPYAVKSSARPSSKHGHERMKVVVFSVIAGLGLAITMLL